MLILTRKPGESIIIGDNIIVKVVSIEHGQIKLGIEAPKDLKIYRTELYEQIQQQNTNAARVRKESVVKAAKYILRK